MIRVLYVPCDEDYKVEVRELDASLASYQRLVGGYIEGVQITETVRMYCNEEGKIYGLPANYRATDYLWEHNSDWVDKDVLCGNVVIFGGFDQEDNDLSVLAEVIAYFEL